MNLTTWLARSAPVRDRRESTRSKADEDPRTQEDERSVERLVANLRDRILERERSNRERRERVRFDLD